MRKNERCCTVTRITATCKNHRDTDGTDPTTDTDGTDPAKETKEEFRGIRPGKEKQSSSSMRNRAIKRGGKTPLPLPADLLATTETKASR